MASTSTSTSPTLYTMIVTLSPSPPPGSVDWGKELCVLDALVGLWDAICQVHKSDPVYGIIWIQQHIL